MARINRSSPDTLHGKLGAGLGGVYEKSTFTAYDYPASKSILFGQFPGRQIAFFDGLTDSVWGFGFQAYTGLCFDITPKASVNLGYRYLHVNQNVSVDGSSSGSFGGSSVELGLTWKL